MLKRKYLRRSLVILFILLLAAPFTLPFILLNYQKNKVKHEVKEKIISGMDRKDLVLLTFSVEEIDAVVSWHHPGEFEFQGEMYDIVEKRHTSDSISYWCWHDEKEKNIDRKLENLVAKTLMNDPQKKESQKRVITWSISQ